MDVLVAATADMMIVLFGHRSYRTTHATPTSPTSAALPTRAIAPRRRRVIRSLVADAHEVRVAAGPSRADTGANTTRIRSCFLASFIPLSLITAACDVEEINSDGVARIEVFDAEDEELTDEEIAALDADEEPVAALESAAADDLAVPMDPSFSSVCEDICENEGEIAYFDCISTGGGSATCRPQRLMAYRACVRRACMSWWENWTVKDEEITDPWSP